MLGDGIKQTTSTTGTTTALVLASVSGYPQISDYFADDVVLSYYLADSSTPAQEEWGIGTYSASGGTLSRTIVTKTYSSGILTKGSGVSPVSLVGTTTVVITPSTGTQTPGRRATIASGLVSGNPQLAAAFPDGYQVPQGGTATTNRIYLSEYIHKTPRAIKAFRAYVGSASGNINFALYRVNADGSIGKQLCTTGSKPTVAGMTSYALTTPMWLAPDGYVCVVQVDNATASFRLAYGYGNTFFGPDSSGNSVAFMTADPGSFTLPTPWSGTLTPVAGGNAGPAVFVELA